MAKKKTPILDIREKIVRKSLDLAQEQGWENVTLADIAQACELSLAALYDHIDDKMDVLMLFGRMIDRQTLEAVGEPDVTESARDLIFDILMERFEVLNVHRGGLVAILNSFKRDPKDAVISAPYLCRSMTWMVEAAGLETRGIRGAARVAGVTGVYLKSLKVWMGDESADMAKVMASLDKDLNRLEQLANSLGF